jgi:hypothetical protein
VTAKTRAADTSKSRQTAKSAAAKTSSKSPSTTSPKSRSTAKARQSSKASQTERAGVAVERLERTGGRTVTITVPPLGRVASSAANAALLPVAVAREVLPAKGGLPLYVGLGALGAADVLDWPVAIGIGVGYAVLRRAGPLAPPRAA